MPDLVSFLIVKLFNFSVFSIFRADAAVSFSEAVCRKTGKTGHCGPPKKKPSEKEEEEDKQEEEEDKQEEKSESRRRRWCRLCKKVGEYVIRGGCILCKEALHLIESCGDCEDCE